MNHYQKLAALQIRIVSIVFVILGLLSYLTVMAETRQEAILSGQPSEPNPAYLVVLLFILPGIIGYVFSRPLGSFLAKDLE